MSLYNDPAATHGQRTIEFPVNIAAAQVGEPTPQPAMLDKLRNSHEIFGRVEGLPAEGPDLKAEGGRDPIRRLESLAKDQGADYLLVYAATVENHVRVTPLSVFDLTLIGAFLVPSREIESTSRASGALIDVRTGTVVLSSGSVATHYAGTSAAAAESVSDKLSGIAHDDSLMKLADGLVGAAQRRAAEEAALDASPAIRRTATLTHQEK